MSNVRPCRDDDRTAILAIINAAAEAYRGVIPVDRWHEPYMPRDELHREIAAGVTFWGFENDGALVGVMGFQSVRDVDLIRHAYVLPGSQRRGVGGALLRLLRRRSTRRMLVGARATRFLFGGVGGIDPVSRAPSPAVGGGGVLVWWRRAAPAARCGARAGSVWQTERGPRARRG